MGSIIKRFFQRKKAYTIIEIMIVVVIIAVLSTITYVVYVNAQAKARDSKRRADVQTIANALQVYHIETKSWLVQGLPYPDISYVGTGLVREWGSSGTGWFNREGAGGKADYSLKSIAAALVERKFLIEILKDPKVSINNGIPLAHAFSVVYNEPDYMVYECPSNIATPNARIGLAVYAKLEYPNEEDQNGLSSKSDSTDLALASVPVPVDPFACNPDPINVNGMNYMIKAK